MDVKSTFYRGFAGLVLFAAVFLWGAPVSWCGESDYYGTYAGTFSGGDEGVWIAVLSDDSLAHLFVSFSTKYDYGDGGNVSFIGETGTAGTFTGTSMKGNWIEVVLDGADHTASGNWSNPPFSGTLKGGVVTDCPDAGSYSGSLQGDVSGTITGTIASDGTLTITASVEGTSMKMLGACHPDGYIMGAGTDPFGYTVGIVGKRSGSGFSGEWESETGDTGTFTANASAGGGGDSGGGGCFIFSLTTH